MKVRFLKDFRLTPLILVFPLLMEYCFRRIRKHLSGIHICGLPVNMRYLMEQLQLKMMRSFLPIIYI